MGDTNGARGEVVQREVGDYLEPRGKMAIARAINGIDNASSRRFAEEAFREVVELSFSTGERELQKLLSDPAPWPIQCEPALVIAHCEALELARRFVEVMSWDAGGPASCENKDEMIESIWDAVDDLRWGQQWSFDDGLQLVTSIGVRTRPANGYGPAAAAAAV